MNRVVLLSLFAVASCSNSVSTRQVNTGEEHGWLVFEDDSANGTRCYGWLAMKQLRDAIACVPLRRDTTEAK